MLIVGVFNLVNKGQKALLVGLSLIVKSIVLDLLMRLNDSIRIKSVIYLRFVLKSVKYYSLLSLLLINKIFSNIHENASFISVNHDVFQH